MKIEKKYLIIGGIVITIVIVLLLSFVNNLQNGSLEITTPETQSNGTINVTITLDDGTEQRFTMGPKSTRSVNLKAGTHRVNTAAENIKSVDIVKITAGNVTKLAIAYGTQLTATKIGTDAEYCPYVVSSMLYTYNCRGEGFIYKHISADALKIPVLDAQLFEFAEPYATGFLGFPITNLEDETRSGLKLHFIDMQTQTIQLLSLPVPVVSTNVTMVTSPDPSKTFFALVLRDQSKIYLFKNTADQNPIVITLPDNKKFTGENNTTSFSFDGESLVAYLGKNVNGEGDDGHEDTSGAGVVPDDHSEPVKADGHIYEYDLQGKLNRTLTVPDDFWADDVTRLGDNYFAASNIASTDVYFVRDTKVERIYQMSDVIDAQVIHNKLYLVADNGVFQFIPQQNGLFGLSNVFNSSKIKASRVFSAPDNGLLFTGLPNTIDDRGNTVTGRLNVYKLQ